MKFTKTWQVALGGVLAAGSLAVLWLACVVPSGQLGVTAAAGLFPVGAVLAAGRGAGLLCWAAASILGLLLQSPDLAITEAAVGAGVDTVLFLLTLKTIHALKGTRFDKGHDEKH